MLRDISTPSQLKVNDSTLLSRKTLSKVQIKALEAHRVMSELKTSYTKSCREIVFKQRRSSNPRPGPIPAPLPLAGVLQRQRNRSALSSSRRSITSQNQASNLTIKSPASTIKVNSLLDSQYPNNRSTMPATTVNNTNSARGVSGVGAVDQAKNLPSVFSRSSTKRGIVPPNIQELESFNLLGVFNNQN